MASGTDRRRYVAPAAFLLAVTIAVVLVRAGLEHRGSSTPTVSASTTSTSRVPDRKFWIVKAGDTFGVISSKTGVPVSKLQKLNPKTSSTTLFIGERIRLR